MRFCKHLWQDPGQEHLWTVSFVCCLLVCRRLKLNCAGCLGRGSGKVGYIMEGFKAHIEKIQIYLRGIWEPLQDPEKGGVYDRRRRATALCRDVTPTTTALQVWTEGHQREKSLAKNRGWMFWTPDSGHIADLR